MDTPVTCHTGDLRKTPSSSSKSRYCLGPKFQDEHAVMNRFKPKTFNYTKMLLTADR